MTKATIEEMLEKRYKTRKMVKIGYRLNGLDFETLLKFCNRIYPHHNYIAYSTGENKYTIWYSLNYTELEWIIKHTDVDDYGNLITLE